MSRSGYSYDCDYMELYRASVDRAIKGKRGQTFLKELATAMDAMAEKRLISGELVRAPGEVCAIGSVCEARGLDVSGVDYDNPDEVAKVIGIARCLAAEIEYINDEDWRALGNESPEERWQRVRRWVAENIR